jgi:hypothetical protein
MRGTAASEYEGGMSESQEASTSNDKEGLYHLRILLPTSYPMSAPDIIFMTPNGRFELGKKVCRVSLIMRTYANGMVDLHRWLNFLSCGIMATCLGSSYWYVHYSPFRYSSDECQLTNSGTRSKKFLDARWRSSFGHWSIRSV